MKMQLHRRVYTPAPRASSSSAARGERVLLALSGGVDSSVAALLLREQGYEVHGAVIRFSPAQDQAIGKARETAEHLGIPLEVLHAEHAFEQNVVVPFCESYAAGETPNPCVVCNPTVKFAMLAQAADELGIQALASGHYAQIGQQNSFFYIAKAQCAARDQSYMLYRLPQAILSRLALPLGHLEKDAVREIAAQHGLSSATEPDSQEICFIPDGGYAAFIKERGFENRQGRVIGPAGEDLGPHKGVIHYTVGQRKGLGLPLGKPVYVQAILPSGDIQLCDAQGTQTWGVLIDDLFTASGEPLTVGSRFEVKVRSVAKPVWATVQHINSSTARLVFDTAVFASAPGQHAVLYDGPLAVGGGRITKALAQTAFREEAQ